MNGAKFSWHSSAVALQGRSRFYKNINGGLESGIIALPAAVAVRVLDRGFRNVLKITTAILMKEVRMSPEVERHGPHQFKTATELVGYMKLHSDTPRALVHFCHLVELAYLAEWDISTISKKDMDEAVRDNTFVSLHRYDESLVKIASENVAKKIVPENWREKLEGVLTRGEKLPATRSSPGASET